MAENKDINTLNPIVKGKIANAITSAAKDHVVATANDLYNEETHEYLDEIIRRVDSSISDIIGKLDLPFTVTFIKKRERSSDGRIVITTEKCWKNSAMLSFPPLKESEFVDGGYWSMNPSELRSVTGDTTVYYITPYLTYKEHPGLVNACYNGGLTKNKAFIRSDEASSITPKMVENADSKLFLVDVNGERHEVFNTILYDKGDGKEPIIMASYNLKNGTCKDDSGIEYQIINCYCYGKDHTVYKFSDVSGYGGCFYGIPARELALLG